MKASLQLAVEYIRHFAFLEKTTLLNLLDAQPTTERFMPTRKYQTMPTERNSGIDDILLGIMNSSRLFAKNISAYLWKHFSAHGNTVTKIWNLFRVLMIFQLNFFLILVRYSLNSLNFLKSSDVYSLFPIIFIFSLILFCFVDVFAFFIFFLFFIQILFFSLYFISVLSYQIFIELLIISFFIIFHRFHFLIRIIPTHNFVIIFHYFFFIIFHRFYFSFVSYLHTIFSFAMKSFGQLFGIIDLIEIYSISIGFNFNEYSLNMIFLLKLYILKLYFRNLDIFIFYIISNNKPISC